MPTSSLGKWSLGLILVMPVLLFLGMTFTTLLYEGVAAGGTIAADIVQRPVLALTMLAGFAAGVAAFIIGLVAIIRQKDYAVFTIAATVVGGLFTLYLIAEMGFS